MPISIEATAAQVVTTQTPRAELPTSQAASENVAIAQAKVAEARQTVAESQAKAAEAAASKPSVEEVQQAAKDLSDYISVVSRSLSIAVDSDLGRPIVTVLDADTSEVVRQIPTEEVVRLAKYLRSQVDLSSQASTTRVSEEALTGILLNQQS